jgi:hypothetical protein
VTSPVAYRQPLPLARVSYETALAQHCPACAARPGERCDGSRIPRWDGLHFARWAAAEKAQERR